LSAESFKASASEILSVLPVLKYFLMHVLQADRIIPREASSFIAMCRVVTYVQQLKHRFSEQTLADLKASVYDALRLHVHAHGKEYVRPKHHYMLHMHRQCEEDRFLLDCFVHERKHQVAKEKASHCKNTEVYERSILMPVANAMLHQLRSSYECLQGPSTFSAELSAFLGAPCYVSQKLLYSVLKVARRDVLSIGEKACLVEACLSWGSQFGLLVYPLALVARQAWYSEWRRTDELQVLVLPCASLQQCSCWYYRDSGELVVL
jgi:hypothetical protein